MELGGDDDDDIGDDNNVATAAAAVAATENIFDLRVYMFLLAILILVLYFNDAVILFSKNIVPLQKKRERNRDFLFYMQK